MEYGFLIDMNGVTYRSGEMIEKGGRMIIAGTKLIATNIDPNCSTAKDIRPGCGAIVAMLKKRPPAERLSASASPALS